MSNHTPWIYFSHIFHFNHLSLHSFFHLSFYWKFYPKIQSKENTKHDRRMRLWDPTEGVSNTALSMGDEYSICEQFFRKMNSIKNNTIYKPDIAKDCLLSGFYNVESFDFTSFSIGIIALKLYNAQDCVCSHLNFWNIQGLRD